MFKNFFHMLRVTRRFNELTKAGADPHAAGEQIMEEESAKGLDPATLQAILAFIMQLIQMFFKTSAQSA